MEGDTASRINGIVEDVMVQVQEMGGKVDELERWVVRMGGENTGGGGSTAGDSASLAISAGDGATTTTSGSATGTNGGTAGTDANAVMVRDLQNQRIQLVMDIQQQEYTKLKLKELVSHNSEMVSSVKEYLENKHSLVKQDYALVNSKIHHYVKDFVSPNVEALNANNVYMMKSLKLVEKAMVQLEQLLSLGDGKYQEKVDEVIKRLNSVCNE